METVGAGVGLQVIGLRTRHHARLASNALGRIVEQTECALWACFSSSAWATLRKSGGHATCRKNRQTALGEIFECLAACHCHGYLPPTVVDLVSVGNGFFAAGQPLRGRPGRAAQCTGSEADQTGSSSAKLANRAGDGSIGVGRSRRCEHRQPGRRRECGSPPTVRCSQSRERQSPIGQASTISLK